MRTWIIALLALTCAALPLTAQATTQATDADVFAEAATAYRERDLATAESLWRGLLREDAEIDRADVLFNLGNVAWRQGDALTAAARYTACIRLAPRHADAWHNLEFVRAEAGLEPADRGDLAATGERLLGMLTPAEAGWTSLGLLALFAVLLMYEALRGGVLGRRLALAGALVFVLGSLPWLRHATAPDEAPWFVVEPSGAALRSEPRESGTVVERLDAGAQAARIDELPGWVRLRTANGAQGWAAADEVVDLAPLASSDPLGS